MAREVSIHEVCTLIWRMEEEHGLLSLEVDGVKFWQTVRLDVYYALTKALKLFGAPHGKRSSRSQKIKHLFAYFKAAMTNAPDTRPDSLDFILIDHPRKVLWNEEYQDIYSVGLLENAVRSGQRYEVFEYPFRHRHWTSPNLFRKYLDGFVIRRNTLARMMPMQMDRKIRQILMAIEDRISSELGVRIDLVALVKKSLQNFKAMYPVARKILRAKKPKRLYVVVAYKQMFWVKAAKELGIEVVELQHGVINRYHLGYSYPNSGQGTIEYFPDRMILWDIFWKQMSPMPIAPEKMEVAPFCYALEERKRYAAIQLRARQILVVSQGSIGEQLAKKIAAEIDSLSDFQVCIKMHPSEFGCWQEYVGMNDLQTRKNVEIYEDEKSLYELLASSAYVVGVNSTVLFEALGFRKKVLVLDLPGSEYLEPLIESGEVYKTDAGIYETISMCSNSRERY